MGRATFFLKYELRPPYDSESRDKYGRGALSPLMEWLKKAALLGSTSRRKRDQLRLAALFHSVKRVELSSTSTTKSLFNAAKRGLESFRVERCNRRSASHPETD
jgi:hypothetical protein